MNFLLAREILLSLLQFWMIILLGKIKISQVAGFSLSAFCCCCCLFVCFSFLGPHGIWRFTGKGSNWNHSCWPTWQPQQCRIWAVSSTYTTAHSNAVSLTHWVRSRIEPTTSWLLVRFVSTAPQWELHILLLWIIRIFKCLRFKC